MAVCPNPCTRQADATSLHEEAGELSLKFLGRNNLAIDPTCRAVNLGMCLLELCRASSVLIGRRFNDQALIDTTPLPDDIPKVKELGASSAPLLSASYFIGARCKTYNDDYMMCKTEANGRGELDCMKEGRKVTRCAASV